MVLVTEVVVSITAVMALSPRPLATEAGMEPSPLLAAAAAEVVMAASAAAEVPEMAAAETIPAIGRRLTRDLMKCIFARWVLCK
ncbi:uncharacterized protein BDZ83DRAFT_639280 [Colletotrichum acutatum]|uniref:Uncharacterized protein n=1 Tax=Glomerella acutata TaxID=27357 RepID=A0AAD8UAP2_GLOAC|nr:uncharacterized protein BDZ83DRAFT_639280 [Colletotrichum acutatum]KAK1711894.1 hypothetical protein BDZ83DRAFT_639280 [Colletotrichum acutatum]